MEVKLITRKGNKSFYKPVEINQIGNQLHFKFGFDAYLKDEIKAMDGARWDPETKQWRAANSPRNWFQLRYLMGDNPYDWYEQALLEFTPRVNLYEQQLKMAREAITYRQVLWAAEMGLGKTLAAFMVMEWAHEVLGYDDCWWVGPLSALAAFHLEVRKWGLKIYPTRVLTYEGMVKLVKNWEDGTKAPQLLILDEFSRCKTIQSQRSQATAYVANSMRKEHGENSPIIVGMTGTPAPKYPLDWYSLCEIIKPGFLREGNIHKFRDRLAIQVKRENLITGGVYPELLGWRDDPNKCKHCGLMAEGHEIELVSRGLEMHAFEPGVNEVAKLYSRMKGLVHVYFKRDWLKELPDKQYRVLTCKVNRATQNAAEAIRVSAPSTIQALTFLRELSDGFQYKQVEAGTTTCKICNGTKTTKIPFVPDETDTNSSPYHPTVEQTLQYIEVECSNCDGTGVVQNYIRDMEVVASPKDKVLEGILEDHEEDGRLVIYGGFTGTIDRICELVKIAGWKSIRVDGRGWASTVDSERVTPADLIEIFQDKSDKIEGSASKIAFIGHPRSAGMGITLTAASETVYYSNSFNGEDRMQSEDRIHRPGMDINKGALITDIIHLPSDQLILDNLKEKKRLQDMTLGQFTEGMKLISERSTLGEPYGEA